jgi:hypothetical protein
VLGLLNLVTTVWFASLGLMASRFKNMETPENSFIPAAP